MSVQGNVSGFLGRTKHISSHVGISEAVGVAPGGGGEGVGS